MDLTWKGRAACVGKPIGYFFWDKEVPVKERDKKSYQTLCASCPVLRECLDYSLLYEYDTDAVYAGLTRRQRHRKYSPAFVEMFKEDLSEAGLY